MKTKKKDFHFNYKENESEREHTLLCQVKKNKLRKNYFNKFVCVNEKDKNKTKIRKEKQRSVMMF